MTGPAYSEFHPRWLRRRTSTYWWLERRSYLLFILRELSSLFVAWFVVFFLLLVSAVGQGEAAWLAFLQRSAHPAIVALNAVTLVFLVLHAVTWFNLAPQAMEVRLGGRRVPGAVIAGANYAAWAAISAAAAWLLLGG